MNKYIGRRSTAELIELRAQIAAELIRRDVCEHGVQVYEWCEQCNAAYKAAIDDPENGITMPSNPQPSEGRCE